MNSIFKFKHWLGYSAASCTNPVTTLEMPAKFPNDVQRWISDMGTDGPTFAQKGADLYLGQSLSEKVGFLKFLSQLVITRLIF